MTAAAVLVLASGVPATTASATTDPAQQDRVCVALGSISGLSAFASMVGRKVVDCYLTYTAKSTWAEWTNPWFLHQPIVDKNWAGWVNSSPPNDRRQLIISQPLLPSEAATSGWRAVGASGAYTHYAVQLAHNLVAAGLSDAIIRLSWEMNGTWNYDNIGTTAQDFQNWVQFWRKTVIAMRSVPGEHFRFVWCINNITRNIPFASYYPGNDVVDIIGDDVYDGLSKPGQSRWQTAYYSPGGLGALISFAKAHNKPLAIPEWGVGAAGDDSSFVKGIGSVVEHNDVAFQSYFFAHEWATQLQDGPNSLAAYRAAFGDGGYAVGPDNGTAIGGDNATAIGSTSLATASSTAPTTRTFRFAPLTVHGRRYPCSVTAYGPTMNSSASGWEQTYGGGTRCSRGIVTKTLKIYDQVLGQDGHTWFKISGSRFIARPSDGTVRMIRKRAAFVAHEYRALASVKLVVPEGHAGCSVKARGRRRQRHNPCSRTITLKAIRGPLAP